MQGHAVDDDGRRLRRQGGKRFLDGREFAFEADADGDAEKIKDVDVQIRQNADWLPLGAVASESPLDDEWFPPAL